MNFKMLYLEGKNSKNRKRENWIFFACKQYSRNKVESKTPISWTYQENKTQSGKSNPVVQNTNLFFANVLKLTPWCI